MCPVARLAYVPLQDDTGLLRAALAAEPECEYLGVSPRQLEDLWADLRVIAGDA